MKKTNILIAIGIVVIIVVAVFKDKPQEDLTATADISDELAQLPSAQKNKPQKTVDFSQCEPEDSFKADFGLGSSNLEVLKAEEDYCLVETTFELEGGYYINECRVPLSLGTVVFEDENFDPIAQHCTIKTSGGGLLELQ